MLQLNREKDMKEKPRNDLLAQANEAQHRLLGKRFCSSCQSMRVLEGGKMFGSKVRRWKCSLCLNREAVRKYQGKAKPQED